ncbi:MAG: M64 family metallopeptidase, partial [Candidatus Zixiibacteriota bacterium]
ITALLDTTNVKWGDLIEEGTPIPTPWDKEKYDSLKRTQAKERRELLRSQKYYGKVGCFEGAGYASKGLYRPAIDCRMFSKSLTDFDPVCRRAIERVIDFYTK